MTVDLDAYFERIQWGGGTTPTFETLARLEHAHTGRIPFENLDVLLGRPVRLDLEGVQAKLVRARRGGYCFEHATLFAAVLEEIGFRPIRHAGRVILFNPLSESPRTHMFLTVEIEGGRFIVDPGFGPFGSRVPVPLEDGKHEEATHWMTRDGGLWTLNLKRDDHPSIRGWATTLEQENPVDFVVANHFIATHPASPFVSGLMLSAVTPDGRVSIMNQNVTIHRGSEIASQRLPDRTALRGLLADHFGFDLPEVESLTVPTIPEWR
jgi:N-hydroxyarylamine O-acetyltransferase